MCEIEQVPEERRDDLLEHVAEMRSDTNQLSESEIKQEILAHLDALYINALRTTDVHVMNHLELYAFQVQIQIDLALHSQGSP